MKIEKTINILNKRAKFYIIYIKVYKILPFLLNSEIFIKMTSDLKNLETSTKARAKFSFSAHFNLIKEPTY